MSCGIVILFIFRTGVVLCQFFWRKGGGYSLKLCNHGSVFIQWFVDVDGVAKCVLKSVRLSCPFFIVLFLCLSRIYLFRCPSVLNMVVSWQSLHGCSPIVVHCCVASL